MKYRPDKHYRFPRTLQEAFKDADYASAVEHPPRRPSAQWAGFVIGCAVFVVVVALLTV